MRLNDPVLSLFVSRQFKRNVGEHLVGVHVRRRSSTSLVPVDEKLIVILAPENSLSGFFDSSRRIGIEEV